MAESTSMDGVGLLGRRLAARRRGSLAVVALLVAVTTAVGLGSAAGARRVASAYDRLDRAIGIADAEVQISGDADPVEAVAAEDDLVAGIRSFTVHMFAPEQLMAGLDFVVVAGPDAPGIDDVVVVDGAMPGPDDAGAVAVNEEAVARLGVSVGDELPLQGLSEADFEALASGGPLDTEATGPRTTVRVVGVVRHRRDIAQREQAGAAAYGSAAFARRWSTDVAQFGPLLAVTLRPGVTSDELSARLAERFPDPEELFVFDLAGEAEQVRDAVRLQAGALALVAVGVALAGLLALAQASARHAAAGRDDDAVLRAIGADRRLRRAVVTRPLVLAGAVGVAAGAGAAVLGSTLFPVGGLDRVEPDPGMRIDVPVLLLGVAAVVLAIVLGAHWAVRRIERGPGPAQQRVGLAERLATALPPTSALGVRLALSSGADRSTPARQGVLGAVVVVAGAVAALTFATSLDGLRATPSRYGWSWDAELASGDVPEEIDGVVEAFRDDERVATMSRARVVGGAPIGGAVVQAWALEAVVGPHVGLTVLDGREPSSPEEVLLGPATAEGAGVAIGETVEATGDDGPVQLRVVGIGLFPVIETEAYTDGAGLTVEGLDRLRTSEGYEAVLVDWVPGVDADEAFASLQDDGYGFEPGVPPAVANLDEVDGFPGAVGVVAAVLGAVAVVHCVVVGARRRRVELAVLAALGMPRRRLAGGIAVQGLVLAAVGLAAGIPLGIAAGRVSWRALATSLDVVPVTEVPAGSVAVLVLLALGGGLLVVAGPAAAAARLRTAELLRNR